MYFYFSLVYFYFFFSSRELFILTFSSLPRITRHARHNYQERGERRGRQREIRGHGGGTIE